MIVDVGLGGIVGTEVMVGDWDIRSSQLLGVIVGTGELRICPIPVPPSGSPTSLKASAINDS